MAQVTDYIIDNQTFPAFRGDLNDVLDAGKTNNSGTSQPTSPSTGMLWADTTDNLLKVRNPAGTDWNVLGRLETFSTPVITANTTLDQTYNKALIPVNASGGGFTITLPSATVDANYDFLIVRQDNNTSTDILIQRSGSDTINGQTELALLVSYGAIRLSSSNGIWNAHYMNENGVDKRSRYLSVLGQTGRSEVLSASPTYTDLPLESDIRGVAINSLGYIDINSQNFAVPALRILRNSDGLVQQFLRTGLVSAGSISVVGTTTSYKLSYGIDKQRNQLRIVPTLILCSPVCINCIFFPSDRFRAYFRQFMCVPPLI